MMYKDEHKDDVYHVLRVDVDTGEILTNYDDIYEVCEYKGASAKEKRYIKATSIPPVSATCEEQVLDFMKYKLDGRVPMVTFSNNRTYFDADSGSARLERRPAHISKPQYKLLEKIVQNLTYRNVMIGNRKDIAKKLGLSESNLNTALKKVFGFVDVYTQRDGMRRGEIKIVIEPSIGFKYPYNSVMSARERAIMLWQRGVRV